MKHQLVRSVLSLCNESTTQKMAESLSERQANVTAALQRIVPAILTGFADGLQESPKSAETLMLLVSEVTRSNRGQKSLPSINDEAHLQKGHEILQQLFGVYNVDVLGKQIARATMLRSSSALKLMQWAAALCFAAIGKEAIGNQLDAVLMIEWLNTEPVEAEVEVKASRKTRDHSWLHFFVLVVSGGVLFWILKG
jgi:hypothetical protein